MSENEEPRPEAVAAQEQPPPPAVEPPPAAAPLPPAPDPQAEVLRQAIADRGKPRALSVRMLLFAGTLGLFVFTFKERNPLELPMLVGVLLFHELGHYAAMRAYGYKNLQLLFIPFVGAAAMGRRTGAVSQWQSGVILLAGPMPGLLIGIALLGANQVIGEPLLRTLALQLVVINGLNLLPIVPLDGGRLLQGVLFSRHPVAEIGFSVAAALALLWWSARGEDTWAQWVAYFVLMGCFHRWRVLQAARELKRERPAWSPDLHSATDEELFALERAAAPLSAKAINDGPKIRAAFMEQLHEVVATAPATLGEGAALGGLWLAGLALVAGGLLVARTPQWRMYQPDDGLFRIDLPGPLTFKDAPVAPGGGYRSSVLVMGQTGDEFCMARRIDYRAPLEDLGDPAVQEMVTEDTKNLLGTKGRMLGTEPFRAWPAQNFVIGEGKGTAEGIFFATPEAAFLLMAASAKTRQRCFDSFTLLR